MASPVRVHDAGTLQWQSVTDVAAPHLLPRLDAAERASHITFHEPGDADTLQLFEIAYEPGAAIEVHAHLEDEIIYVVAGTMKLGARDLGPGSSVFVAGNTLYSFAAGPDGLRLLNFRPRRDDSFVTRDEHVARRAREGQA